MDEPRYPSVQGQPIPNLGLAQCAVATPQTTLHTNSDSTSPLMDGPLPLAGNRVTIAQMGINPAIPFFDLELANAHPVLTPGQLTAPQSTGSVTEPTFSAPDMGVPGLRLGDLQAPAIDKPDEWAPDPTLPNLLAFAHPGGLSILAATRHPLTIDPMTPDLSAYDRPAGLDMPGPLLPDPALPDLQYPQFEQEIHMRDRPGDLALNARDSPSMEPSNTPFTDLWMQQQGMATHRSRHLGMLHLGLTHEEHDR